MPEEYDLIDIGTGLAASKITQTYYNEGWQAALVDRRARGGTCRLRGCKPQELLWGVAEAIEQAQRLAHDGLPESAVDGIPRGAWRKMRQPLKSRRGKDKAEFWAPISLVPTWTRSSICLHWPRGSSEQAISSGTSFLPIHLRQPTSNTCLVLMPNVKGTKTHESA